MVWPKARLKNYKTDTQLQEFHPTTRVPPNYRSSIQLQEFQSYYRSSILLQEFLSYYRSSIVLQEFHPTTGVPSYYMSSTIASYSKEALFLESRLLLHNKAALNALTSHVLAAIVSRLSSSTQMTSRQNARHLAKTPTTGVPFLLQELHPTTGVPSLLQEFHPNRSCILLQELHPTAGVAAYSRNCILLPQDTEVHPTTRVASY